jgi:UDP:flavonoid glycosyltransferase YjiC (YdhE family)
LKTILIAAAGNSLSHLGKALSLYKALQQKSYRPVLAACSKFTPILERMDIPFESVAALPGENASPFPVISWFSDPDTVAGCLREEIALLEKEQPDAIIGIFRFTLKAAAQIANIPYYSLSCGCLMPNTNEPLGFPAERKESKKQQTNIDYFFRYAGSRLQRAADKTGISLPIRDAREMLLGEQTFLWDFPEFMPIASQEDIIHCGPIDWNNWPYDKFDYSAIQSDEKPLALVSFGTCNFSRKILTRIVDNLCALGYQVIFSTGGQSSRIPEFAGKSRQLVTGVSMLPLEKLLPFASLLVCHGGQLSIFAALKAQVPVLVMPFQPEQAHNAVCLERMGCGYSLVGPTFFYGRSDVYHNLFDNLSDCQIRARIRALTEQKELPKRLRAASLTLAKYRGAETVAETIERTLCQ